ncbi:hypothetical protein JCGZ_20316 [Jatropha curcas]|uniref:Aminotransferase-like plant mobile domain-containing protein n=1 Tax=Jatropha curcas TaxID=180498 RepID=A0A067JT66_JATCU|nr:hypothetical protein JCGZ_20316 [Jatropha curcas]
MLRGVHLKVGYRQAIEIMKHLWGDVADCPNFIQVAIVYQQRRLLLLDLFYDMYYLGERVYEWELGPDQRRVPHDVPYYMLSSRSIQLEQDIVAAQRGLAATVHFAAFVPSAYAIFRDKRAEEVLTLRLRRWSDYLGHAGDTSGEFVPDVCTWLTHVSITNYNEVSKLYEAACLKLTVVRLSNEHVFRASMAPPVGRGRGAQCGGHAYCRAGCQPVVVEETEDSGSEDSEETTLNMS